LVLYNTFSAKTAKYFIILDFVSDIFWVFKFHVEILGGKKIASQASSSLVLNEKCVR
jgi:hypothetical protein